IRLSYCGPREMWVCRSADCAEVLADRPQQEGDASAVIGRIDGAVNARLGERSGMNPEPGAGHRRACAPLVYADLDQAVAARNWKADRPSAARKPAEPRAHWMWVTAL